ncbi:MAG: DUF4013 domain-containing protein [Candidatus Aminicenantia bacterium]
MSNGQSIDWGKGFTILFEDKEWVGKTLIGGIFFILSLILIGIPFLLGYLLAFVKNIIERKSPVTPEWDNLGDKFTKGLVFTVIMIIYSAIFTILIAILIFIPCLGWIAAVLLGLFFYFVYPFLVCEYAVTNNFSSAFNFERMFRFIGNQIGNLLIATILSLAIYFISGFGLILLIIGIIFTYFWALVGAHYFYAEVYKNWSGL